MSSEPTSASASSWLTPRHELPADDPPGDIPAWSEHYLTYAYEPDPRIGLWITPDPASGPPEVWEELVRRGGHAAAETGSVAVVRPGGDLLVAKSSSGGTLDRNQLRVGAVSFTCDEPFVRWTKSVRGGMRSVTPEQLRAEP